MILFLKKFTCGVLEVRTPTEEFWAGQCVGRGNSTHEIAQQFAFTLVALFTNTFKRHFPFKRVEVSGTVRSWPSVPRTGSRF